MAAAQETRQFASIPPDLKERRQWVTYQLETRNDKPTKIPYDPKTGKQARSDDPKTWTTFDHACKLAAVSTKYHGIGFMFSGDDPYTGIDLDHCRDAVSGVIEPWAQQIIDDLASYTEISQSKTGVHIIVAGNLAYGRQHGYIKNTGAKKRLEGPQGAAIEVYDSRRYFVVTGDHLASSPAAIVDRQDALKTLLDHYFQPGTETATRAARSTPLQTPHLQPVFSDNEILDKIMQAKNSAKFQALWNGDISSYSDDESAADLAFCSIVAFYTRDADTIDRLYRRSGLMRDKWERDDYRNATIAKAIAGTQQEYGTQRTAYNTQPGMTSGLDILQLSDVGNAARFTVRHQHEARYIYAAKKWMVWNGRNWQIDSSGAVMRMAIETVKSWGDEDTGGDLEAFRKITKHMLASLADSKLRSLLSQAQAMCSAQPDDFDRDPQLITCLNGTLDLATMTLRPHSSADLITKVAKVNYDPAARCSTWDNFVQWAVCGDDDLAAYLQRAIGYAATGVIAEHALFIAYGQGGNGKSTFFNTIQAILGRYSQTLRTESIMESRRTAGSANNDIAALQGARLVIAGEGNDGDRLAEGTIKQLTGGDRIRARYLHAEEFEFDPSHKLFFFTNHKPVISGTDNGIWRRIKLIPFEATLDAANIDTHLSDRLMGEASGIFNWIIAGVRAWQAQGLGSCAIVDQATQEYRTDMDIFAEYLAACTIADRQASASSDDLYKAYTAWCEKTGTRALARRRFGMSLTERGFTRQRSTGGRGIWLGIRLIDDPFADLGTPPPPAATPAASTYTPDTQQHDDSDIAGKPWLKPADPTQAVATPKGSQCYACSRPGTMKVINGLRACGNHHHCHRCNADIEVIYDNRAYCKHHRYMIDELKKQTVH